MADELVLGERLDPAWVDSLAPVELRHYYNEMVRIRASRQREQLSIQVSAAAVIADGGKLAKAQDSALSVASARPNVRDEPADPAGGRLSPADVARAQRSDAETAHLWRK